MSKLFYDHLISFKEIEIAVKKHATSSEEKEEFDQLVDSIVNGKVLEKVLDKLPNEHHEEFLALFHSSPHDEIAIFQYLKNKTNNDNIEEDLGKEIKGISADLLKELKLHDETLFESNVSKK